MDLKKIFIDDKDDIRTSWFLFIILMILVLSYFVGVAYGTDVFDTVKIDVGIVDQDIYESYTKGVPCICDVYVEKVNGIITNQTVIAFIWNSSETVW